MMVRMTELGHIFYWLFLAETSKKELQLASHYYLKIPNFLDLIISLFKNFDNFLLSGWSRAMPILPNVFSCYVTILYPKISSSFVRHGSSKLSSQTISISWIRIRIRIQWILIRIRIRIRIQWILIPIRIQLIRMRIRIQHFKWIRIRKRIINPDTDPDPDFECGCGYGSREPIESGSNPLIRIQIRIHNTPCRIIILGEERRCTSTNLFSMLTSVADPDPGSSALLTPGSGIRDG